jgi:nucleoside-diphosphate-sugar epimerase
MKYSEIAKMLGKPVMKVPFWLVKPIARLLWKFRYLEMPHGALDYTAYTWTVDNGRSKRELNYSYKYDTRDTIKRMFKTQGYKVKE